MLSRDSSVPKGGVHRTYVDWTDNGRAEQTVDRSAPKAVIGRDSIENQSDRQIDLDSIERGASGNYGNKLSQESEDISENARRYADF
jgi:hypothetical protein